MWSLTAGVGCDVELEHADNTKGGQECCVLVTDCLNSATACSMTSAIYFLTSGDSSDDVIDALRLATEEEPAIDKPALSADDVEGN